MTAAKSPDTDGSVFGPARSASQAISLSDTAEKCLTNLADGLVTGAFELWQLPPSLLAFHTYAYRAGVTQGQASRQAEVDRLNAENDRLYLRAYNSPERVKQILAQRVDEGFEAYEAEFFASAPKTKQRNAA